MNKTKQINDFIATWQNQGDEVADKATYWNTLLEILGVPKEQIDNKTFITYEKKIKLRENEHFKGQIDAYIPSTKILIEQKSNHVDLFKKESRPNGKDTEPITPFEQARRYDNHLAHNEKSNFLVLCNFNQIVIYDVRESIDVKPIIIELKDLKKDLYLLEPLVKHDESKKIEKEQKISVAAGDLVNKMYTELQSIFSDYKDELDETQVKHSINMLCVRLVFCLYAEDAGLFGKKEAFYDYLQPFAPNKMGVALKALFETLNTKVKDRTKNDKFWNAENPTLREFPYVNGGLFSDMNIVIPPFTAKLKSIVLDKASRGFDWSEISPTVFGAVFESTLNPDDRRKGGMHYTSVENIHKVIDPLFLNDLKQELDSIKNNYTRQATIKAKAIAFQNKLSKLTFFDPACGSGNFLTETFLSLRRLENEAIRLETNGESLLDLGQSSDWIKVSIKQFYGIEINDFAVSVAKTAMWIAEDQMMKETQDLLYAQNWDFLPLKTYVNIHEGDALKMDWNTVLSNYACHYLISNPPFVGANSETKQQKQEIAKLLPHNSRAGLLDYVSGWYLIAKEYIKGYKIRCAFVSTNSIVQGEQVDILWSNLISSGIKINFAYKSFKWNSEAKSKAHVHVVIIGFSYEDNVNKKIHDNGTIKSVKHINPYLLDAPDITIGRRNKSLSNVPKLTKGNQPTDGGNLILNEKEYKELMSKEPQAAPYIKNLIGAREMLYNKKRYCLWLVNISPKQLRTMPLVLDRVKKVKEMRLKASAADTRKLADRPTEFRETMNYKQYIAIPSTTSEKRTYVPMGYYDENTISTNANLVIPNASLFEFGVLESSVHMDWMRTVAGRLKSDYRYSAKIVYNNFPWLTPTPEQRQKIEETAQGILDARAKYPDSSLADLYDPLTMPADLLKAHKANDKAVLQAYGLPNEASESDIVAHLFKMYEDLTK